MVNIIVLHRNPFVTIFVYNPRYVPSRVTSHHHWIMLIIVMIAPVASRLLSFWWNHLIRPINVTITPMAPVSGHSVEWMILVYWHQLSKTSKYLNALTLNTLLFADDQFIISDTEDNLQKTVYLLYNKSKDKDNNNNNRKYVSNIPGSHEVRELQKTAILGTAHILRKVLT